MLPYAFVSIYWALKWASKDNLFLARLILGRIGPLLDKGVLAFLLIYLGSSLNNANQQLDQIELTHNNSHSMFVFDSLLMKRELFHIVHFCAGVSNTLLFRREERSFGFVSTSLPFFRLFLFQLEGI